MFKKTFIEEAVFDLKYKPSYKLAGYC